MRGLIPPIYGDLTFLLRRIIKARTCSVLLRWREDRYPGASQCFVVRATLHHDLYKVTVDTASDGFSTQYLERRIGRHGRLVRSVGLGERIENVRERNQPCLKGNLVASQSIRIAAAVELFVVVARIGEQVLQVVGHGDAGEKASRLIDVRFDLRALFLIEGASRNLKEVQFFLR